MQRNIQGQKFRGHSLDFGLILNHVAKTRARVKWESPHSEFPNLT